MKDTSIFPPVLIADALRSTGYKNAAYALAELIDNSIQAEATSVTVVVTERLHTLPNTTVRRIEQIAVLDNGTGMTDEVLQLALQFGKGTRLGADKGMGKFGMGLPNASISQATRVDVWTWNNGVETASNTFIDLERVKAGDYQVPTPTKNPVPDIWKQADVKYSKSGTLVVWSNIDKCTWVQGKALLNNSEFLIARMYRKFLHNNEVKIRFIVIPAESPSEITFSWDALPNDPMYLIAPSNTPAPFNAAPAFQHASDQWEYPYKFRFKGIDNFVTLRFSYATKDARKVHDGVKAGRQPHGIHAKKNTGISVMRADRELFLETGLIDVNDPRYRWIGAEISFEGALDDLMDTTSNKQDATRLREALHKYMEVKDSAQRYQDEIDTAEAIGDPIGILIGLWKEVDRVVSGLYILVKEQNATPPPPPGIDTDAETLATEGATEREKDGHIGESDKQKIEDAESARINLIDALVEGGMIREDAEILANATFGAELKFTWQAGHVDAGAFFTNRAEAGKVLVTIADNHPIYEALYELTTEPSDLESLEQARNQIKKIRVALKLMLMSWARMEDESSGATRDKLQETRASWGRMLKAFLRKDE